MTGKANFKTKLTHIAQWLMYIILGQLMLISFITYAQPSDSNNSILNTASVEKNINYHDISAGSLYFKNEQGVKHSLVLSTDYNVDVTALMARTTLTQTFTNSSQQWVEGIYVFPLSEGVAVDAMQMKIGEQVIVAEIKPRQQAKKIYQQAKQAGKKASLLEQERPNLFTSSIANIPPGESIVITISYLQSVRLQGELFSLRLPLTITPRYIPGEVFEQDKQKLSQALASYVDEDQQKIAIQASSGWSLNTTTVVDAARITPLQIPASAAQQATINVNLNIGFPLVEVSSLYHKIRKNGDQVSLQDRSVAMNRDFVLTWRINPKVSPNGAFFSESKDGYDYGLIMINPPKLPKTSLKMRKEMLYIIDTSGSMGGVAIRQAKQALEFAVQQLEPLDKFNIIEFNSSYRLLFAQSTLAATYQVDQAINWIRNLDANGGTEMLPALQQALASSTESGFIRQIVFITDGSIGNEAQLFQLIQQKLMNARLHTVGIGSAPNSYFMQRAAELGRGSFSYIGNVAEVKLKMAQLFTRINQPLLTDILVQWPSSEVELLPEKIADLYVGEPLIISARWPSQAQGEVVVSGKVLNNSWLQKMPVTQAMPQSGVATWWARQKIKQLNFQLYRSQQTEQKQALISEITEVAIANKLMSKYTSFVAVQKQASRKVNQYLQQQAVANAMPAGTSIPIPLAQTATNARQQFILALMLMLFSTVLFITGRTSVSTNKLRKDK